MKTVIYARVSSTDGSQSYERQIEDLTRWAVYLQLEIVKVFAEQISATRKGLDERIEFNNMLEYIDENDIKHIMVSELSRISRKYIDTVNYINSCTIKGIAIHIHKEKLSTLDENGRENSIVKVITGFISSLAEQEGELLKHRIKSGLEFAAKNGGAFNAKIYGYDKGDDGKPKINEEQSILIKKMFEMLLDGIGTRTIAHHLNENYETKKWTGGAVHTIVKNSFYCGKRKFNNSIITVPAIVSDETFNQAQDFIHKRKRFVGRVGANVNPFASFIKCQCGATMNLVVVEAINNNVYRCANKCGVKSINRQFLIREVKMIVERNASLTKDETIRSSLKQKIEINNADIIISQKEIRSLMLMADANYERRLSRTTDEITYKKFEDKFKNKISKLNDNIKELNESNTDIKNSLSGELLHYSDDLAVFKSQLLKALDFIEIKDTIAVVKIKGWAKVIFPIYRKYDLYSYNKYLKKNNTTQGFTLLDWDTIPESEFNEEVGIE